MASDQMICAWVAKGCTRMVCPAHVEHPHDANCDIPCPWTYEGCIPGSRCVPVPAECTCRSKAVGHDEQCPVHGDPDEEEPEVVCNGCGMSLNHEGEIHEHFNETPGDPPEYCGKGVIEPVQPDSLREAVEALRQYYFDRGECDETVPADEVAVDLRKVLDGSSFLTRRPDMSDTLQAALRALCDKWDAQVVAEWKTGCSSHAAELRALLVKCPDAPAPGLREAVEKLCCEWAKDNEGYIVAAGVEQIMETVAPYVTDAAQRRPGASRSRPARGRGDEKERVPQALSCLRVLR